MTAALLLRDDSVSFWSKTDSLANSIGYAAEGGLSSYSERTFGEWSMGWMKASDLTRIGFDRDLVALRLTQNTLIDAMLKAFREVVRVE